MRCWIIDDDQMREETRQEYADLKRKEESNQVCFEGLEGFKNFGKERGSESSCPLISWELPRPM